MLLRLDRVKKHLRVDFPDDDGLIEAYTEAAEAIVVAYVDRPVYKYGSVLPLPGAVLYDPYAIIITPAVEVAILIVVEGLYLGTLTPSADGAATLPASAAAVLAHLRVWRGGARHARC